MVGRALERTVALAGRRPGRTLALVAVVLAVFGGFAFTVRPTADTSTFVGSGTAAGKATAALHERFGDDAVAVLVKGQLTRLVLTDDLQKLIGLEGCLSGNAPKGADIPGGAGGPCGWFAREKPVRVVYGPGTFINSAVNEIQQQLAGQVQASQAEAKEAAAAATELAKRKGRTPAQQRKAGKEAANLVNARFTATLLQLAVRYGLSTSAANPTINNPDFIYQLVFDPARGAQTPKARFASLFPSPGSALIQVRLKTGLGDDERAAAISHVRAATRMTQWRLSQRATYTTTGGPVLLSDVAADLVHSLVGLLIGGLALMALVLAVVFRGRARMLPLAVALGAAALVFGALGILGVRVTLASIAVLPVLLGLGVDYAIQYQARAQEDGVGTAARRALPTIATAVLATVVGFAVLLLSPVPMVRGFGVLLMAGVVLAFVLAITAGTAVLTLLARRGGGQAAGAGRGRRGRHEQGGARRSARAAAGGAVAASAASWSRVVAAAAASSRGARELLAPLARPGVASWRGVARLARGATGLALRRPMLVIGVGALLAVAGWAVDGRTAVVSDVRRLVPADTPALRDLDTLQRTTGVAGEVDVLVRGRDLARPEVITWMRAYQARVAARYGVRSGAPCGTATVCPGLSLTDLFRTDGSATSAAQVRTVLAAVPAYFRQAVISDDRRSAVLAFGIKLMPLARQERVLDVMRAQLRPPKDVRADLAGLPVLVSRANADLSSTWRRLLTLLAGLALVAVALLAAGRRRPAALLPLAPIAMATGWSALVLWLTGIPLNPMSATLGALVIAISTEFSVLLVARYQEERVRGLAPDAALRRTYASTGRAVLASGATAIAGFAVLAFSDVRMLQDFGRVTVIDLSVSLLGVLLVLPAVLALHERRRARRAGGRDAAAPRAPALVG